MHVTTTNTANPQPIAGPQRCGWCGEMESPSAPLVPHPDGAMHPGCLPCLDLHPAEEPADDFGNLPLCQWCGEPTCRGTCPEFAG